MQGLTDHMHTIIFIAEVLVVYSQQSSNEKSHSLRTE